MSDEQSPLSGAPAQHGMLLGKFLPPHMGHVYLADFARHYVREPKHLSIVVGTLEREPIPGALRFQWMRELFPDANVIRLSDELPQDPSEHPDFWRLWHDALMRVLPRRPDLVFASEDYGWKLAETLGAKFVLVDRARGVMPVSGTAVRADPLGNWQYLPRCVRPYFLVPCLWHFPDRNRRAKARSRKISPRILKRPRCPSTRARGSKPAAARSARTIFRSSRGKWQRKAPAR